VVAGALGIEALDDGAFEEAEAFVDEVFPDGWLSAPPHEAIEAVRASAADRPDPSPPLPSAVGGGAPRRVYDHPKVWSGDWMAVLAGAACAHLLEPPGAPPGSERCLAALRSATPEADAALADLEAMAGDLRPGRWALVSASGLWIRAAGVAATRQETWDAIDAALRSTGRSGAAGALAVLAGDEPPPPEPGGDAPEDFYDPPEDPREPDEDFPPEDPYPHEPPGGPDGPHDPPDEPPASHDPPDAPPGPPPQGTGPTADSRPTDDIEAAFAALGFGPSPAETFAAWVDAATGPVAAVVEGDQAVFADSAGTRTPLRLDIPDTAVALGRLSGRKGMLWADADDAARIEAAAGRPVKIGSPRLADLAVDPDSLDSPGSYHASAEPAELAAKASIWQRSLGKEARRVVADASYLDGAWRRAAQRGYRVDLALLERLREDQHRSREHWAARLGADLFDGAEARRFLEAAGIELPGGSISNKLWVEAVVPPDALDEWRDFRTVRDLDATSGKLTEIRRNVLPDGRVHPRIDVHGAITGRTTISEPALQNLPDPLKPLLVADDGTVLIGFDQNRVEPCVAAALSGDGACGRRSKGTCTPRWPEASTGRASTPPTGSAARRRSSRSCTARVPGASPAVSW
jgi:hypothetical protein